MKHMLQSIREMPLVMRLRAVIGLDRAVMVTLLARAWNIIGGLGTLFFVTYYLTSEQQGYYYTFYSLIALQVFVELGLNYAIIQFASHEVANLQWTHQRILIGSPQAKRRLQSLAQFAFTWFGVAALLVLVVLLTAGLYFFHVNTTINASFDVNTPWMLVTIFTAIALIVNSALAILEGCNRVTDVATIRLAQMLASIISIWLGLALHLELYALALGSFMMAVVGLFSIYRRFRIFFIDLWCFKSEYVGINWRKEIWPFQWRIAVSWMSGYFIFQFFNPLLLATHGPIAAGQMGMSMQIISAMNGIAIVWVTTKVPVFGQLISLNNRVVLDNIFKTVLLQSSMFLIIFLSFFFMLLVWVQVHLPTYAARVLSPSLFVVLCIICLANHLVFSVAAYLRSHKQEPFLLISVFNAVATILLALLFVPPFGAAGAVYSYASSAFFIGLIGGGFVFARKQQEYARANSSNIS